MNDFKAKQTKENILSNYTSNEIKACDDKDLPWTNKAVKDIIQSKKQSI